MEASVKEGDIAERVVFVTIASTEFDDAFLLIDAGLPILKWHAFRGVPHGRHVAI